MKQTFCAVPGTGETRKCLDPWVFVYVRSNGDVDACCRGVTVGNLANATLEEILNGTEAVTLRQQLLTGDLPRDCIRCATRGVTTVQDLRQKVEKKLFSPGHAEIERLQREIRDHRAVRSELLKERAGLYEHVKAIEGLLEETRAHASNLEDSRRGLEDQLQAMAERIQVLEAGLFRRLRERWRRRSRD